VAAVFVKNWREGVDGDNNVNAAVGCAGRELHELLVSTLARSMYYTTYCTLAGSMYFGGQHHGASAAAGNLNHYADGVQIHSDGLPNDQVQYPQRRGLLSGRC
jgi:hypothetical protein